MATAAVAFPTLSSTGASIDLAAPRKAQLAADAAELPPTPPLSDGGSDVDAPLKARAAAVSVTVTAVEPVAAVEAPSDTDTPRAYERRMGDGELSYYLPSRADGVNDMYLHLGFRAPARLLARARVRAAWALLRVRHPLLAARVRPPPAARRPAETDYADVRFVYAPPWDVDGALEEAGRELEWRRQGKDELIDGYLNGPRTLSNERLSYLVVATHDDAPLPTPAATPNPEADGTSTHYDLSEHCTKTQVEAHWDEDTDDVREFDLLICAAHFLGDGMALHRFANDLFTLLAGHADADADPATSARPRTAQELEALLARELEARWGAGAAAEKSVQDVLPAALEDNLPTVKGGRLRRVAGTVDFKNSQERLIGGHTFPRRRAPARRTVVPTVPVDAAKTKLALKRCKERGVSIANALFALCDVAWARVLREEGKSAELPLMMYSALNLRPYLLPAANAGSYWFLAVGYFNVVLPAFLPAISPSSSTDEGKAQDEDAVVRTFWHRAREAKRQSTAAAKHPLIVSRTREMALERGVRARGWAREDDERALGTFVPPAPAPPKADLNPRPAPKAPSSALVGLSLLGNLDGMYKHADYPAIALHTLTTGSRQRAGGMLLFGYTFAGRLWLSLGYDEEGFESGAVRRWWGEVLKGLDEFLLA